MSDSYVMKLKNDQNQWVEKEIIEVTKIELRETDLGADYISLTDGVFYQYAKADYIYLLDLYAVKNFPDFRFVLLEQIATVELKAPVTIQDVKQILFIINNCKR